MLGVATMRLASSARASTRPGVSGWGSCSRSIAVSLVPNRPCELAASRRSSPGTTPSRPAMLEELSVHALYARAAGKGQAVRVSTMASAAYGGPGFGEQPAASMSVRIGQIPVQPPLWPRGLARCATGAQCRPRRVGSSWLPNQMNVARPRRAVAISSGTSTPRLPFRGWTGAWSCLLPARSIWPRRPGCETLCSRQQNLPAESSST